MSGHGIHDMRHHTRGIARELACVRTARLNEHGESELESESNYLLGLPILLSLFFYCCVCACVCVCVCVGEPPLPQICDGPFLQRAIPLE